MNIATKRIFYAGAAVLMGGVAIFAWGFFQGLRMFGIEDQIHGTFSPVSMAIERYAQQYGRPPTSLDRLVPEFLPGIPTSPLVDGLDYLVVDDSNWILNAHSTAIKPGRTYSWRSDWNLHDQEKAKLVKEYHRIAVFIEPGKALPASGDKSPRP